MACAMLHGVLVQSASAVDALTAEIAGWASHAADGRAPIAHAAELSL